MIKVLAVILVILLYAIGGERGIVSFVSLCFNIAVLSASIVLISWGWNPIVVAFVSCTLIASITLFYQNGKNAKTIASFWSVMTVLVVLSLLTYWMSYASHLGGINEIMRHEDALQGLSSDIGISMPGIAVAVVITGLIGAAMDASIAVSSAVYEVYKNNRQLTMTELIRSGLNIGGDILGATVNTLYFACLGEAMSLFILLANYNYSLAEVFNSKAFFQEFAYITFSCISCALVIPLTAAVVAYILKHPEKLRKQLSDDELFSGSDAARDEAEQDAAPDEAEPEALM